MSPLLKIANGIHLKASLITGIRATDTAESGITTMNPHPSVLITYGHAEKVVLLCPDEATATRRSDLLAADLNKALTPPPKSPPRQSASEF